MCLLTALTVTAAAIASGGVTELNTTYGTNAITVSGKVDGYVNAAVVVQILNSSGDVIGMSSFPVDDTTGAFSGAVTYSGSPAAARAADFDGGEWTTATVTIPSGGRYHSGTAAVEAAKTGDMGVMLYGVLAIMSTAGSAAVVRENMMIPDKRK